MEGIHIKSIEVTTTLFPPVSIGNNIRVETYTFLLFLIISLAF